MNKTGLLKKLAPVGVVTFGAISVIGIASTPADALTPDVFHAIDWGDGTSNFYDGAFSTFDEDTGITTFDITFCNVNEPNFDCGASIENAQGDYSSIFGVGSRVEVLSPFPTATWERVGDVNTEDPGFQASADFRLINNPLVFTLDNGSGRQTRQTLPIGSRIRGELELDDSIEFELEGGFGVTEWTMDILDDDFDPVVANRSTLVFDITSNQVDSGSYTAEAEFFESTAVPEPVSILGLLTISGLGLGLKRKKQL